MLGVDCWLTCQSVQYLYPQGGIVVDKHPVLGGAHSVSIPQSIPVKLTINLMQKFCIWNNEGITICWVSLFERVAEVIPSTVMTICM